MCRFMPFNSGGRAKYEIQLVAQTLRAYKYLWA